MALSVERILEIGKRRISMAPNEIHMNMIKDRITRILRNKWISEEDMDGLTDRLTVYVSEKWSEPNKNWEQPLIWRPVKKGNGNVDESTSIK